jgi:hypothetical protein
MSTRAIAGAAALLLTTAPAAWALTPEALWADWQAALAGFGVEMTATETRDGDALVLSDLTTVQTFGGASTRTVYERVILLPDGADRVVVELPAVMALTTETEVDGESARQTGAISHDGLEFTVTQAGDARDYVYRADRMSYRLDGIEGIDDAPPLAVEVALSDLVSDYTFTPDGDALDMVADDFAAATLTLSIVSEDGPQPFELTYAASDLAGATSGRFRPDDEAASPLEGIDLAAAYTHAGAETTAEGTGAEGPFAFSSRSTAGRLEVGLDADGLTERFGSEGLEMEVALPQFPVPITASLASFATGFTLPVGVADEAKPFGLQLAFADLTLDDVLWSLFDPTGQLPRDPATLMLDLSGEAEMAADLFDPEALAELDGPPGEVRTLSLTELSLDAVGVDLLASGDLTFPTPDITAPVGSIDVALDGAFALADRLVTLGLLPAEQVAFVKGMAGLVARPVGEDQLESTITFTEDGGITANGMPLR